MISSIPLFSQHPVSTKPVWRSKQLPMSIRDHDGTEILKLPGFWATLFKVCMALGVPISMGVLSIIVWMFMQIMSLNTRVTLLEFRAGAVVGTGSPLSNSVSINDAAKGAMHQRDYLTTADVAEREGVSVRTVVDWILKGRIDPEPEKRGKSYTIAENYRILPQDSANAPPKP